MTSFYKIFLKVNVTKPPNVKYLMGYSLIYKMLMAIFFLYVLLYYDTQLVFSNTDLLIAQLILLINLSFQSLKFFNRL